MVLFGCWLVKRDGGSFGGLINTEGQEHWSSDGQAGRWMSSMQMQDHGFPPRKEELITPEEQVSFLILPPTLSPLPLSLCLFKWVSTKNPPQRIPGSLVFFFSFLLHEPWRFAAASITNRDRKRLKFSCCCRRSETRRWVEVRWRKKREREKRLKIFPFHRYRDPAKLGSRFCRGDNKLQTAHEPHHQTKEIITTRKNRKRKSLECNSIRQAMVLPQPTLKRTTTTTTE